MTEQTKKTLRTVGETTLIPLGLAIVVIGGASGWVARIDAKSMENENQVRHLDAEMGTIREHLLNIETMVAEMRADLRWCRERKGLSQ